MGTLVPNIIELTLNNTEFRVMISSAHDSQIMAMCIEPAGSTGFEEHSGDQYIFVVDGEARLEIYNDCEMQLHPWSMVHIHAGTRHNLISIGDVSLKLYTIYAPPQH